jgi:hypothetical protein
MSIASSANTGRLHFTATAGQTAFTVSFEFFDNADLDVFVNDVQKTITTHYTVSGGDGSTGTVTFGTGLSVNDAVTIVRRIDIERVTDFSAGQAINRAALNTQLDTITAIASDNKDRSERGIRVPDSENAPTLTIPSLSTRKGRVLGFNASTGAMENGPLIADVQTLAQVTADIATLGDIEDGTDATDAIQTVAGIASNVTTVAGNSSNVTTVAGISSNVTTVAGVAANVTTVAGISSDVTAAAGNSTNINLVGSNISNVNALGPLASDISTVSGISANVTTVAGIASDVSVVSDNALALSIALG